MLLSTLVVLSLMQADRQPSLVIDLSAASTSCPDDASGGGQGHGMGEGSNAPELPPLGWATLIVGEGYSPGSPLDYQITLANLGDEPLRIPVLPRGAVCDSLRQNERGMSEVRIALRFRSTSSRNDLVDAVTLWATPSNTDSHRMLAPGEKALIRVSKVWRTLGSSDGGPEGLRLFVHIDGIGRRPIESSTDAVVRARGATAVR
jgi:hypothetical protein